jgi:peroxiredoxin
MSTVRARSSWIATVALMAAVGGCRDTPDRQAVAFPYNGSTAPPINLPVFYAPDSSSPTSVRLADQRGGAVLLSFWSLSCGPCLRELPALSAFATQHRSDRLHVFGILIEGSVAEARSWLTEHGGASFPMLDDTDGEVQRQYLVHGIPDMYLIGPDGRVASHCLGCVVFDSLFSVRLDSLRRTRAEL